MIPGQWRVIEYGGRTALERLEADWRRLYASMPLRSSAHLYEAHLAYYRHLMASPDSFRCLALTDGERVRAICPLVARQEKALGIPIPAWVIPRHLLTPIADVICPEDDARRVLLPAIVSHLKRERCRERLITLGPLPQESVLWEGLRSLGTDACCTHVASTPFVFDCEQPFPDLMRRLSKGFRKQLRNCRNRLTRLADVRFETAADDGALAAAFDTFLDVEASGWKGATGTRTAIRFKASQPAFFRQLASTFGCGDRCEINALFAEGHCIAAEFCIRTGEEYSCAKIGYDERYARLSPGHLLHARTLERCCLDPEIKRYNQISHAAWLDVWHPDGLVLQQVHVGLGRWSAMPLTALLRFRFGRGRATARWVHHNFGGWRRASSGMAPRASSAPSPRARKGSSAAREHSGGLTPK
jgi:hypothetical protein